MQALTRIKKNLGYFRINYFVMLLATCAVTFIMNPSSLLVIALLLAGWIYVMFLRTSPLEIGGRTLSEREKLIGMSAISFITIFFLTRCARRWRAYIHAHAHAHGTTPMGHALRARACHAEKEAWGRGSCGQVCEPDGGPVPRTRTHAHTHTHAHTKHTKHTYTQNTRTRTRTHTHAHTQGSGHKHTHTHAHAHTQCRHTHTQCRHRALLSSGVQRRTIHHAMHCTRTHAHTRTHPHPPLWSPRPHAASAPSSSRLCRSVQL
jgi:hypothetical protein